MRDFLRFVVEETLAGNARQLKGFTIAREVFGRDEDFDAALDPVVRIQAGWLRRAIERYYLVVGGRQARHEPDACHYSGSGVLRNVNSAFMHHLLLLNFVEPADAVSYGTREEPVLTA
jgi:hypothetical protein